MSMHPVADYIPSFMVASYTAFKVASYHDTENVVCLRVSVYIDILIAICTSSFYKLACRLLYIASYNNACTHVN